MQGEKVTETALMDDPKDNNNVVKSGVSARRYGLLGSQAILIACEEE